MTYFIAHKAERERIAAHRLEQHRRNLEISDRAIARYRAQKAEKSA